MITHYKIGIYILSIEISFYKEFTKFFLSTEGFLIECERIFLLSETLLLGRKAFSVVSESLSLGSESFSDKVIYHSSPCYRFSVIFRLKKYG